MKKLLVTSALIGVLAPSIALAETKNFEGFSAGLNLNLISAGLKFSDSVDNASIDSLGGKQTQSASLDFGYGLKIGSTSVMTIGLDIDLSKPKIFELTDADGTLSAKQKNRYGLYLAPGVAINKDVLVYGKLSYNKLKGEITGADKGADPTTVSETFSGVGYGIGAKVMLSKNSFLKIEAQRQTYSSKTDDGATFEPSATVGTVGIGMQF